MKPRRLASLAVAGVLGLTEAGAGCGAEPDTLPTEPLVLHEVTPRAIVPGTELGAQGRGFVDAQRGLSMLHLQGTIDGRAVDANVPAEFVDDEHLELAASDDPMTLLRMGTGEFVGSASVRVVLREDGSVRESAPLSLTLGLHETLQPELDEVIAEPVVFINDTIEVRGSGLLLGGHEGDSWAVLGGCFTPDEGETCEPTEEVAVPLAPTYPDQRVAGTFPLPPRLTGIHPGTFEGSVVVENRHASGTVHRSDAVPLTVTTIPTRITAMDERGSLAQYIDVSGGGFIGGEDGTTLLRVEGWFSPDGGDPVAVEGIEIVPEVLEGRRARYVLGDEDGLGELVDLRRETGTFEGTIRPVVLMDGDELVGSELPLRFEIDPVEQVVFVQFNESYVESLRHFGLRAMDQAIRERVLTVLRRDYTGINVEFRTEPPDDFRDYAVIEIAGPDVNGTGLLGYDNTPGKDFDNERLYDHIGGVNAEVQQDGFPGFGGVFVESIFVFSEHPPHAAPADAASPLFDRIFDPFRPDLAGSPVEADDLAGIEIPTLTSGASCPTDERRLQIACAVWTLGSVVGSTTSHELGHSLGLAPPGLPDVYHWVDDGENRLMDQGGYRSFTERAELMGDGPSRFCVGAYQYLREILPTDEPEHLDGRPGC